VAQITSSARIRIVSQLFPFPPPRQTRVWFVAALAALLMAVAPSTLRAERLPKLVLAGPPEEALVPLIHMIDSGALNDVAAQVEFVLWKDPDQMRVLALGEGRLLEAVSGERMPRRPVHPGPPRGFGERILAMLRDSRTWTTLAYFVLMLPLGTVYFTIAVTGIALGAGLLFGGLVCLLQTLGLAIPGIETLKVSLGGLDYTTSGVFFSVASLVVGLLALTLTMHVARAIGGGHARLAKSLLVTA